MELQDNNNEPRKIKDFLSSYSFGKLTILNLVSVSFGIIADGIEMTLMGLFVIPITKYYSLTPFEVQVISSLLFLGVALGSYLSSYIVQFITRKQTLFYSYLLLLVSHVVLSFSFHSYLFAIARVIIGVALGVIVPVSLNLLSEFLPDTSRAFCLTGIWIFFSLGQGFQALIILIGMPNLEETNMKYVLFTLSLFIVIALMSNHYFITESPNYLIINRNYEEAFDIIDKMLIEKGEEIMVLEEKEDIMNENKIMIEEKNNQKGDIEELFVESMYTTTLFTIILMFILSFLFYGIILISTLTMKQLNISDHITSNRKIITDQIIVAFTSMPGNLIGGLMCEIKSIGRKRTICIGFIISTICLIMILIFHSYYTILYSVYLFFVNISFNVTLTYVVEVYPSELRDTSSGFLFSCLRISGFFSQYLYLALNNLYYMMPYYFSGLICLIAVWITVKLPYEPIEEIEKYDKVK